MGATWTKNLGGEGIFITDGNVEVNELQGLSKRSQSQKVYAQSISSCFKQVNSEMVYLTSFSPEFKMLN